LAFKPNIDDLRESPAKIYSAKSDARCPGRTILYSRPNIEDHHVFEITNYTSYRKADIVVFLVSHNEFKNLKISK
jgi:UDP-N-acetyl-D-mannosaminuronic acid dehydrogenase